MAWTIRGRSKTKQNMTLYLGMEKKKSNMRLTQTVTSVRQRGNTLKESDTKLPSRTAKYSKKRVECRVFAPGINFWTCRGSREMNITFIRYKLIFSLWLTETCGSFLCMKKARTHAFLKFL